MAPLLLELHSVLTRMKLRQFQARDISWLPIIYYNFTFHLYFVFVVSCGSVNTYIMHLRTYLASILIGHRFASAHDDSPDVAGKSVMSFTCIF